MQEKIENHYLIGNLQSAALVSNKASINWLCLPYFDSHSVFGKILDEIKGGSFHLDDSDFNIETEYEKNNAVVSHLVKSTSGEFTIKDFMPPVEETSPKSLYLVRRIENKNVNREVRFYFNPRSNYGSKKPDLILKKDMVVFRVGDDSVILHLPKGHALEETKDGLLIKINLDKDEVKNLILEYRFSGKEVFKRPNPTSLLEETRDYWSSWVQRHKYVDFAEDLMVRSAITLKLHQFYPTGAIIASPTTSLPEVVGGQRNWDYRYVWLRDATFTLYSLMILGCKSEARLFFNFLETSVGWQENPDLELMYTIRGKKVPKEEVLGHLSGYKGSSPVRIGNAARQQFQLDVYGTVIDFIYFAWTRNIPIDEGARRMVLKLVASIESNWKKKDQGLWEMRSKPKHFTHSKVMSWVGINRTLLMSRFLKLDKSEFKRLRNLQDDIKSWVNKNLREGNKIKQHNETEMQDATNFLFVSLRFLDKDSLGTKEVINETCKELLNEHLFVYRYKADDSLEGEEGAFVLATYWLISALAIIGETERAKELFMRFSRNIVSSGLMPEEINPKTGEYLGNFPQAFSHMGLIMAAHYIDKYENKKGS